jgi:hypothetical protein
VAELPGQAVGTYFAAQSQSGWSITMQNLKVTQDLMQHGRAKNYPGLAMSGRE